MTKGGHGQKKNLNKRVVVLLLTMGGLLGLLAVAGIIYSLPADPKQLFQRAGEYEKAGNFQRAVECYGGAVEVDRKPEYLLAWGKAMWAWFQTDRSLRASKQRELFWGARRAFIEARRRGPTNLEAHQCVVEMEKHYLDLLEVQKQMRGRAEVEKQIAGAAIEYIDALTALLDLKLRLSPEQYLNDEQYRRVLFDRARARCEVARSREEYVPLALEDLQQLIQMQPRNEEYRLRLGAFHLERGEGELAERSYREAIEAVPESAKLPLAYAGLLRGQPGRHEEAVQKVEGVRRRKPRDPEVYRRMSGFYRMEGKPEVAIQVLREGIEVDPTYYYNHIELAKLLSYRGEPQEVERLLRRGLEALEQAYGENAQTRPSRDTLLWYHGGVLELNHRLCDALLDRPGTSEQFQQTLQEVRGILVKMERIRGEHPFVTKIRGRLALAENDLVNAEKLLRQSFDRYERARRGRPGERYDPKTANLLVWLYNRLNQPGEAQSIMQRCLAHQSEPAPSTTLALVRMCLEHRKYEEAQGRLQEVLSKHPDHAEALELKAVVDVVTGKAERVPEQLKELDALKTRIFLTHARGRWQAGDRTGAMNLARDILQRNPTSVDAAAQLVRWHRANGDMAAATRAFREAVERLKDDRAAKERLTLAVADEEKRLALEIRLAQSDSDPVRRLIRLARAHARANQRAQCETYLRQAAEKAPKNPFVLDMQFQLALSASDWKAAETYLPAIAEVDLDTVGGRMYRARLARARGEWDEALRLTGEALKIRPRFSDAHALLGDCYLAKEQYEDARGHYETAYQQNPSSVRALLGLVAVSRATGETAKLGRWLELAYRFNPNHPLVREPYLEYRQGQESPEKTIERREQIARGNPDDLMNLERLAGLYEQAGRLGNAESLYELILERDPGSLRVVRKLAYLLRRTAREVKGEKLLIDFAANRAPDKVAAYLTWGDYLEECEKYSQARETYQKCIEMAPDDQRGYVNLARHHGRRGQWDLCVKQHRQYLQKFAGKTYPRAEHDMIEYLIQADQLPEASRRIDQLIKDQPNDARAQALKGLVYLRQNQYDQAKEVLDACINLDPVSPAPLMYRAEVHLAQGALQLAREDLERARRANAPASVSLKLAAIHENMGDFAGAHTVLTTLLKDQPGFQPALDQLVGLCQRHGRRKLLSAALDQARKAYPRRFRYWAAHAEELMTMNRPDLAAALLEQAKRVLPETPEVSLWQMRALVRAGQLDQALQVGEGLRNHPELAPAALAIHAHALLKKRQDAQAEQEFQTALKTADSGLQLDFVVGEIVYAYGQPRASQLLHQWVSVRPDDWRLRLLVGDQLLQADQPGPAVGHYRKGLELTKQQGARYALLRQLALAYYQWGRNDASLEAYKQALELNARDQVLLNNFAWLLVDRLHRPDEAAEYVQRALKLRPYDPHTLDTYGVVLMSQGKLDQAAQVLNRSVGLRKLGANLLHLGQTYEKMNRKDEALRQFRRAWEAVKDNPKDSEYKAIQEALRRYGEAPRGP